MLDLQAQRFAFKEFNIKGIGLPESAHGRALLELCDYDVEMSGADSA